MYVIYIYIYIHTHIHMYTHLYAHVFVYIHIMCILCVHYDIYSIACDIVFYDLLYNKYYK